MPKTSPITTKIRKIILFRQETEQTQEKREFIQCFLKKCETSRGRFQGNEFVGFLVQVLTFYGVEQGQK